MCIINVSCFSLGTPSTPPPRFSVLLLSRVLTEEFMNPSDTFIKLLFRGGENTSQLDYYLLCRL